VERGAAAESLRKMKNIPTKKPAPNLLPAVGKVEPDKKGFLPKRATIKIENKDVIKLKPRRKK